MSARAKKKPEAKELRQFGVVSGLIVAGLFGLLSPWLSSSSFPVWPWAVAVLFWLPAILAPVLLGPVFRAWMKLGRVLNWVMTRLVLGIAYYCVVFPTGLILRLAGKDPMASKRSEAIHSYRTPSSPRSRNDMERPF